MEIDILKNIVNVSTDKKNTILFFLKPKNSLKLKNTDYVTKDMLYLNNKIFLVKKNTLDIKYKGKIIYNKKNKLGININNKYNIYINDIDNYYIFRNKIKSNDQTLFFQKILSELDKKY